MWFAALTKSFDLFGDFLPLYIILWLMYSQMILPLWSHELAVIFMECLNVTFFRSESADKND